MPVAMSGTPVDAAARRNVEAAEDVQQIGLA
jgi:hypothetical protein